MRSIILRAGRFRLRLAMSSKFLDKSFFSGKASYFCELGHQEGFDSPLLVWIAISKGGSLVARSVWLPTRLIGESTSPAILAAIIS